MTEPIDSPENLDALETRDWLESLEDVHRSRGPERVASLLSDLQLMAQKR